MCHHLKIFLWCSDDMIRVVQLHRDVMPICEAAQCSDVTSGWDALYVWLMLHRGGMPICVAAQCADVPRDVDVD